MPQPLPTPSFSIFCLQPFSFHRSGPYLLNPTQSIHRFTRKRDFFSGVIHPIPKRPSLCTHIKVTGHSCGSPALRGEFFCYFHTRIIKGVQQRVDMRLDAMALLEDCEAIQFSIMHVVDALLKGTLDPARARLVIQALRIAARNAKNVRFDDRDYRLSGLTMVCEIPDYARQYLIEHPELGPPIASSRGPDAACGAGAPARKDSEKAGTQQASPVTTAASPKIANPAPQPEASLRCSPRLRRLSLAHAMLPFLPPDHQPRLPNKRLHKFNGGPLGPLAGVIFDKARQSLRDDLGRRYLWIWDRFLVDARIGRWLDCDRAA